MAGLTSVKGPKRSNSSVWSTSYNEPHPKFQVKTWKFYVLFSNCDGKKHWFSCSIAKMIYRFLILLVSATYWRFSDSPIHQFTIQPFTIQSFIIHLFIHSLFNHSLFTYSPTHQFTIQPFTIHLFINSLFNHLLFTSSSIHYSTIHYSPIHQFTVQPFTIHLFINFAVWLCIYSLLPY